MSIIFKQMSLYIYQIYLKLIVNLNAFRLLIFGRKNISIKVFYGGARTGSLGGPLVKVHRLNQLFPESKYNFNLTYCLSNTPYLTQNALKKMKANKIPIILNQNGVFYKGWYPKGWEEKNLQMSGAYHIADYVFWQSEFSRATANSFLGERKGPGEILFNAVDLNLFKPKSNNVQLPSRVNFLIVGKFNSNHLYAIEPAIMALKSNLSLGYNFHLSIAGYINSTLQKKIIEIVENLGISDSVSLIGRYNQIDAPVIYRSAHVLIHLKYLDPCPNVVIEGMASGLPVIYSESGGTAELLNGIAGIPIKSIINFEQPPIFVDQSIISISMIEILKSYSTRSTLARDIAEEKFDLTTWRQQHDRIFKYYLNN